MSTSKTKNFNMPKFVRSLDEVGFPKAPWGSMAALGLNGVTDSHPKLAYQHHGNNIHECKIYDNHQSTIVIFLASHVSPHLSSPPINDPSWCIYRAISSTELDAKTKFRQPTEIHREFFNKTTGRTRFKSHSQTERPKSWMPSNSYRTHQHSRVRLHNGELRKTVRLLR